MYFFPYSCVSIKCETRVFGVDTFCPGAKVLWSQGPPIRPHHQIGRFGARRDPLRLAKSRGGGRLTNSMLFNRAYPRGSGYPGIIHMNHADQTF